MIESTSPGRPAEQATSAAARSAGIADPPLPFTGGRIPASEEERQFVERRVMLQFFIAPALSLAVLLAGFNFGWPRLATIGVIGLGLSALLVGYLAVSEQRLMFMRSGTRIRREFRYFIYEGFAAVPYGLAIVILGAVLIVPATQFLQGTSLEQMRSTVLGRPHLALIPLGLALLFHGLGFLIGFGRRATSSGDALWIGLKHLPARLGGLILLGWAVAMLFVGAVEWVSPARFDAWFASVFGNPWPFARR